MFKVKKQIKQKVFSLVAYVTSANIAKFLERDLMIQNVNLTKEITSLNRQVRELKQQNH